MLQRALCIGMATTSTAFTATSPRVLPRAAASAVPAFRLNVRMASTGDMPTSEEGWMTVLSPNQFAVLRQKATEPPGYSENTPGELENSLMSELGTKYPKEGTYDCAGCGTPLCEWTHRPSVSCDIRRVLRPSLGAINYMHPCCLRAIIDTATSKFDSGCGWPAFYEGVEGAIQEVPDADGMRVEIVCSNCKGQSVTPTASLCQLNFQPRRI